MKKKNAHNNNSESRPSIKHLRRERRKRIAVPEHHWIKRLRACPNLPATDRCQHDIRAAGRPRRPDRVSGVSILTNRLLCISSKQRLQSQSTWQERRGTEEL